MTMKQAVANKTESSTKQEKHYRGVTLLSTGKYGSIIWDSKRKTSIWLGTFNSDTEAARAFDCAAVRLRGSRAILNFPDHETGKSSSKGCKILKFSGKKRKIKEKESTVESTISDAEPMLLETGKSSSKEFKISGSSCCEGKIEEMLNSVERAIDDVEEVNIEGSCKEKPSTVKNMAIPPQAAILNMTPQSSAANKTESSMEKEKHYRGVKLLSTGKYGAQIHDPKSKAYKWLGTFNRDIEAAKAFDIAAVRLRGRKAILNFPKRETLKSGSKGSETLKSSYKKRKMEAKGRSGEKRYRGVTLQSTGKYGANIWDPKRKALLWIGTFNSDIEAAKAFDSAAVRLHGRRAILNFPEDEAAKSSSKGSEILKSSFKKRKMKEKGRSVEKHYRGVKLQSAGKYGAQIHDSKSKAYIWLGTFNSNIEAAKAYDRAALMLRGSRAILNFPEQEAGKPSLEGSKILRSSCKKRKMEEKGTNVVKHHRGAYRRPSGKYRAEIRNKGARISLGTFNIEPEAAKANDSAGIGLHSTGAALNFPVEVGKPSSKESKSSKSCRKRMIEEMVKNVDTPTHDVNYKEVEMESSFKERNIEKMVNRVQSSNEDVQEVEIGSSCMERKIAEMVNWVENPHGEGDGWNLVEQASKVGHLSRKQALELYLQVLRWDLQDSWLCWEERELF